MGILLLSVPDCRDVVNTRVGYDKCVSSPWISTERFSQIMNCRKHTVSICAVVLTILVILKRVKSHCSSPELSKLRAG